jgi:hypothetical protein
MAGIKQSLSLRKRWLLGILLLFLPVAFEKKKSNKIPVMLATFFFLERDF